MSDCFYSQRALGRRFLLLRLLPACPATLFAAPGGFLLAFAANQFDQSHLCCITAPDTDLAATADVALTVDIPEFPDPLKPTASRYAFLAIIDLVSSAVGTRLDPDARETLRRIKYTVLNHRKGKVLEPLGD